MFQFAGLSDDGRFTVALRLISPDSKGRHAPGTQQLTQFFADRRQRLQAVRITAREWVVDHGHCHSAASGRFDRPTHLDTNLIHLNHELTYGSNHTESSLLAIPSIDLLGTQSAEPLMYAWPTAHRQYVDHLIGRRCARYPHFDRIEMAAHVAGIDMSERHVDRRSGSTHFFRRWHDGQGIARLAPWSARRVVFPTECFAHRVAAGSVPQRTVLQFTGGAHDGGFTVALNRLRFTPKRHQQSMR